MRAIEKQMLNAINTRTSMRVDNTTVSTNGDETAVHLHGHEIATINWRINTLTIRDCGWRTSTTKSRLNAILGRCGAMLYQKKGEWYLDDNEWKGEATLAMAGLNEEVEMRADLVSQGLRIPDTTKKRHYGPDDLKGNNLLYTVEPSGDHVLQLANGERATVYSIDLE